MGNNVNLDNLEGLGFAADYAPSEFNVSDVDFGSDFFEEPDNNNQDEPAPELFGPVSWMEMDMGNGEVVPAAVPAAVMEDEEEDEQVTWSRSVSLDWLLCPVLFILLTIDPCSSCSYATD